MLKRHENSEVFASFSLNKVNKINHYEIQKLPTMQECIVSPNVVNERPTPRVRLEQSRDEDRVQLEE